MTFVARFLGRRFEYTYALVELVPGERLVTRTAQGPFPMEPPGPAAAAAPQRQPERQGEHCEVGADRVTDPDAGPVTHTRGDQTVVSSSGSAPASRTPTAKR